MKLPTGSPGGPPSRRPALLPTFGALPAGWAWCVPLLLLTGWVICLPASAHPSSLLPSGIDPDLPGILHTFWLVPTVGMTGFSHARTVAYPTLSDFQTMLGMPLDAILCWPFTVTLGFPTGFTVFQTLSLGAFGITTAWLAGRWSRSWPGAVLAGVAAQTSGILLRELTDGRHSHLTGAIFVPLALGWYARALVEGRPRDALLAGAMVGLSALTFWYWGLWVAFALLVLFALALAEGRNPLPSLGWGAAGSIAVAGFSLLYVQLHAGTQRGTEISLWSPVVTEVGATLPLIELLETRDLLEHGSQTGALALRPLSLALAGLAVVTGARRRWLAALGMSAVGVLLALGPAWRLPGHVTLLTPTAGLSLVPMLRRFWWPDRYLLVGMVGTALLVGGGAALVERKTRRWVERRWAGHARWVPAVVGVGLAGAYLAESYVALPTLPLETTDAAPSERARAAATERGPWLVLPLQPIGGATTIWYRDYIVDLAYVNRPLVTGLMPPETAMAPAPYQKLWQEEGLVWLRRCEGEEEAPATPGVLATLRGMWRSGVESAWVDTTLLGTPEQGEAYLRCLEGAFGTDAREIGPYRVYPMPRPAPAEPG